MNEIYWMTRFDIIYNVGIGFIVIPLIIFGIAFLVCFQEYDNESIRKIFNFFKKIIILPIIGLCVITFIPTSKEAYAIYGIGEAIDSIKEKIEISDKCNYALEKFAEEYSCKK